MFAGIFCNLGSGSGVNSGCGGSSLAPKELQVTVVVVALIGL